MDAHAGTSGLDRAALNHGFSIAFYVLAGLAAIGAVIAATLIGSKPAEVEVARPVGRGRAGGGGMSRFRELNDLVLQLKGLVLVRELQESEARTRPSSVMYDTEIDRVRDLLAEVVKEGGGAERVAA